MFLQEGCPDENVCYLDVLGHILCVCLARADCAQNTIGVTDGSRSRSGRSLIPNGIKHVAELGGCSSNLVDYLRIPVVKDMFRSIRLDETVMFRAASRDDF